jgi:hypothetical protein
MRKKKASSSKEKILTRESDKFNEHNVTKVDSFDHRDRDTFIQHFGNPDFESWAKMEFWNQEEALFLSLSVMPPDDLGSPKLRDIIALAHGGNFYGPGDLEQFYNNWFTYLFSEEIDSRERLMSRAGSGIMVGGANISDIDPLRFVRWAERIHLDLPAKLVDAVKKYHPEEPENHVNSSTEKNNDSTAENKAEKPLSVEERRDYGRLKTEKSKWDKSIKAAVEAALMCKDKKIIRKELEDKLFKYRLPDTTLERIWVALREKGLTKEAGRPSKKNPRNILKSE